MTSEMIERGVKGKSEMKSEAGEVVLAPYYIMSTPDRLQIVSF